jgi:hypothetical protein
MFSGVTAFLSGGKKNTEVFFGFGLTNILVPRLGAKASVKVTGVVTTHWWGGVCHSIDSRQRNYKKTTIIKKHPKGVDKYLKYASMTLD